MAISLRRRGFLQASLAAAGSTLLDSCGREPAGEVQKSVKKYVRHNATSAGGQKALASYAKGIEAMLNLPAAHPHNWFRNAFIHLIDCPHGNWWFYVWHRGYLGYFEETIRKLSGDPEFAIPYWDWTTLPRLPDSMFDGVLTPTANAYLNYTKDLNTFTSFIKDAMTGYWGTLSTGQLAQLKLRGYNTFDDMWNEVTGNGVAENMAFAQTARARHSSKSNPDLDPAVAYNCSPFVVYSGLWPQAFNDANAGLGFTSVKASSHNAAPAGGNFSVLEGLPHNQTHNFIGGVPAWDPGPYGNMTNNLSPVDPIFFLHHSNMDRLWDVWTRKQIRIGRPFLPSGAELDQFSNEPFLFFVNGDGGYVGNGKAGDYLSVDRFNYEYEPGFGEDIIQKPDHATMTSLGTPAAGKVAAHTATVALPKAAVKAHMAEDRGAALFVTVTVERPAGPNRAFYVFVGAPAGAQLTPDSPYYAGTIAFFGKRMAEMSHETTFVVPLPRRETVFAGVEKGSPLTIRLSPVSKGGGGTSALRSVSVRAL